MDSEETAVLERLARLDGDVPLVHRYGGHADNVAQIWLPATAGPHPVVVLLHGGYWRDGYRLDTLHALARAVTERGWAAWNVEYRRVGPSGGGWPATFLDVAAAVDALAGAAPAYGVDLSRVAVAGHSAGGLLALWVASRGRLRGGPGAAPVLVPALAVSLAGVCDPYAAAELRLSNGAVVDFLGGTPHQRPEAYAHAAPHTRLPLGVPQLLAHGTADDVVPYGLSSQYHARASAAGDRCRLLTFAGAGHFQLIDPTADACTRVLDALAAEFQGLT